MTEIEKLRIKALDDFCQLDDCEKIDFVDDAIAFAKMETAAVGYEPMGFSERKPSIACQVHGKEHVDYMWKRYPKNLMKYLEEII